MRVLFLALAFFCSAVGFGAAPIFHVVVAEKWLEVMEDYDEEQKQAFMLGTLFPDIRHLGKVSREITHEEGVTLEKIKETDDPFLKGLRLHNFVDIVRDEFLGSKDVQEKVDQFPGDSCLYLKILEDAILYARAVDGLGYIADYLESIDPKELSYNIPKEIVEEWHRFHQIYFLKGPYVLFAKIEKYHIPFGPIPLPSVLGSNAVMEAYREDPFFIDYVDAVLTEFDRLFSVWQLKTRYIQ